MSEDLKNLLFVILAPIRGRYLYWKVKRIQKKISKLTAKRKRVGDELIGILQHLVNLDCTFDMEKFETEKDDE